MKNILKFLNDSIIIFGLICVVVAAFLGTYALSPVAFENSILAQQQETSSVLGQSDVKNLEFEDIFKEHEYFTVNSNNYDGEYRAVVILGPISQGRFEKDIVQIINTNNKEVDAQVSLKFTQEDLKNICAEVVVGETVYSLNEKTNAPFLVGIGSEESVDARIGLNIDSKINYPISFEIIINKVN